MVKRKKKYTPSSKEVDRVMNRLGFRFKRKSGPQYRAARQATRNMMKADRNFGRR